jgi:FkbH-like protein
LDNTLYSGVIGEDRLNEIVITDNHLLLQKYISDLSDSGVLIFLATKNNPADVELAFKSNLMPNLPRAKIASIFSGWESKANSMVEIIKLVNFSEQNILFVDDNGRELSELATKFPNVLTVGAKDTELLLTGLRNAFAFQRDVSGTSETRIKDIQAKDKRNEILESSAATSSLLADLKTIINSVNVIQGAALDRANELFNKTNQFNFSLKRSKIHPEEIGSRFGVVNTTLSDVISDSGTISSLSWELQSGTLRILEFVISCRALGRGTEKYILKSALSRIQAEIMINKVVAEFEEGPRNLPSQEFLETYFHKKSEGWVLDWDKLNEETPDIGNEIFE